MMTNNSITDELRKYAQSWRETPNLMDDLDAGDIDGLLGDIEHIADHIDAEYEKAIRELNNLADASVLLPVDADGEVWHVGDFAVGEVNPKNPKVIERMIWYGPDSGWQLETDTIIHPCPDRPRHHHATTVEDVLAEFFEQVGDGLHTLEAMDTQLIIAEYAAKMRAIIEGSKGPEWQETDSQDEKR